MGLKGTVPARAPRSENVVTGGPACGSRADTCLRYLIFMSTREQGALGVIVCLALLPAPTRAACDPVVKIVSKSWKEDPMLKEWGRPGHSHCTQVYTNTNSHRCMCMHQFCLCSCMCEREDPTVYSQCVHEYIHGYMSVWRRTCVKC
jgi:hypothetical protein